MRNARPGYVCGAWWYSEGVPTFSQRISELRLKRSFDIQSTTCNKGHDHADGIFMYTLISDPERPNERLREEQLGILETLGVC